MLRPLLLTRSLNRPYGLDAVQSATWTTIDRAVAPLLLAATGIGPNRYPFVFACAAAGIGVVAWHSPQTPPRDPVLAVTDDH